MKGDLSFTQTRGHVQYYIDGTEVYLMQLIQNKYNLTEQNCAELLKQIQYSNSSTVVKNTMYYNLRQLYYCNYQYNYECRDLVLYTVRSKSLMLGYSLCGTESKVQTREDRNFNFMTIDSAMNSFECGIPVQCSGDHKSCFYGTL